MTRKFTAIANVNFALSKYWGKRDPVLNLPATSSLSVTIDNLESVSTVQADSKLSYDELILNDNLISKDSLEFKDQIEPYLNYCRSLAKTKDKFKIKSKNNFPTGAGLASSASGFAAMSVAINQVLELGLDTKGLSVLARRGSGSATRSILGGFNIWNKGKLDDGSDSHIESVASGDFWPDLRVLVCVTVPELILIDTKRMQQIITNLTSKVSEIALNDSSIELKIDRAIDATRDKLIFKLIVSRANPTHLGNSDIFDTFYEEDAQDKLGMAISASLIKLMKGDIKLEPFPDQSAVLLFWVPLVEYKEDQTPTKESLSILKTTSEPMKILVAEDNPINRKLTKTILEQEGHEVLTVVDGIEAIEAFKEGDFDLVLMDVQMPRLDGYEAAKIIKEGNKCEFPIIALSTHISPEEKEKQENAGMCDYISKPIKKESLIKIVEHYNHNCIARK